MLDFLKQHSLIVMLVIAAIFTFDWLFQMRKRLKMKWYAALILTVLHIAFGVASVKLFAIAEAGFDLQRAGNMSLFGAIFFLPVLYFAGAKLFKRSAKEVFDIFTLPIAATLLCARVNCLIKGCCLGQIIPGTELRWPTREAELVFWLVLIIVLLPKVFKGKSNGRAYPIFLIAYGSFRFVIEFFREGNVILWKFHISHIWALLSIAIGAVTYILLRRKQSLPNGNRDRLHNA